MFSDITSKTHALYKLGENLKCPIKTVTDFNAYRNYDSPPAYGYFYSEQNKDAPKEVSLIACSIRKMINVLQEDLSVVHSAVNDAVAGNPLTTIQSGDDLYISSPTGNVRIPKELEPIFNNRTIRTTE